MSQALTPPFLLAAGLLVVAGLAKLRAPASAAAALVVLGAPARRLRATRLAARCLGAGEVGLGMLAVVHPSRPVAAALAGAYAGFSAVSLALARRQAACGCFGGTEAPASSLQVALSLALAVAAALAAVRLPHGLPWLATRAGAPAAVLLVGLAGALYGGVLAYTEAPRAWAAWRGKPMESWR